MKNFSLTQSAELIGGKFDEDPELHIPEYPRFPQEILAIPFGKLGLLFEGAKGTQVLNGNAARQFVPSLLKHLNGRNSLADLQTIFPKIPAKSIRDTVALLYSRGLLESGDSEPSKKHEELASFLGRYADVTRINKNRGEALDKIARAKVAILGNAAQAQPILAALSNQGFSQLNLHESTNNLSQKIDLLVILASNNKEENQAWFNFAHEKNIRVLHAHIGHENVQIGPLIIPGKSACYDCFQNICVEPEGIPGTDMSFWSAMVALNAFHIVSMIGTPRLYNICHQYLSDGKGRYYEERRVVRLPGCTKCGLADCKPKLSEPNGDIWLLHNFANSMPPRELMSPRDYQHHYAAANISITQEIPEPYYGSEKVILPEGDESLGQPNWLGESPVTKKYFDVKDLGNILRYSVGYEPVPNGQRRIAPSGGGLGSAELFLVVRNIKGLADGVYHYYAFSHYLERIKDISNHMLQGILGITERDLPQLLLVGVGSLKKLRQKYGNFAFRFSNLDAGVTRSYLHHLLRGHGYEYTEYSDVRDKALAELIGLPTMGNRYLITYALGIGLRKQDAYLPRTGVMSCMDSLVELSAKLGSQPLPDKADKIPNLPPQKLTSLKEIFRARRSERNFSSKAIPLPILKGLCQIAYGNYQNRLARSLIKIELKLWVGVVQGNDDYVDGVYAWNPQTQNLELKTAGLKPETLDETMLQKSLARAPVVFYITGNFEQAVTQYGARGYRDLISCAGTIASESLLASVAYGIAGCPWGGLAEDAWGPLFNIDRYRDCPLFGVSLGYAL
ncbi:MAG: SagB/ThcOx family dehydrogenase [Gammaproteobacteria bacterium]|nr:MAG: SagB/ThcOx family dehydrogenase [Gammaproteobacteria bacterium]